MYTWRFMDISTHIELYPSYYLSCIYSLNSTIQRKEDILGLISIQGNVLNKFDAAIVSSTISLWYIIYNSFDFILYYAIEHFFVYYQRLEMGLICNSN